MRSGFFYIIFWSVIGCSNPELSVERYDDQTIKAIGYLENEKKNGVWREFAESGELYHEIEFVNDNWTGEVKAFRNGKILWVNKFVNDKREGYAKYYNVVCDFLTDEGYYKNDEMDGIWHQYHNGYLIGLFNYENRKADTLYMHSERVDYYDCEKFVHSEVY